MSATRRPTGASAATVLAGSVEAQLQQRLFAPLTRLRHRCRLYLLLDGLRSLMLTLLAAGLVQLALDRWFKLTLDQRAALSTVITLYWLWVAWRRLLVPLRRRLPDSLLASLVDRAYPEFCDQLATAVQLSGDIAEKPRARFGPGSGSSSPELVREVLTKACRTAARVEFLGVLNHHRAARRLVEVFGLLLLPLTALGLMPDLMGTWFARNWLVQEVAWPQRTHIWPDGFGTDARRRMARGDLVEITARVHGEVPSSAVLEWWTPSARNGNAPMSLVGEARLVALIGQLSEDVHFRIAGGDERTREFVVEAAERPRLIHTQARLTPPPYTRLDPILIEQQTVLEILQGSTLEITARLNKPIKSARFLGGDETATPGRVSWSAAGSADEPSAATSGEPQPFVRLRWSQPASGSYRFELTDSDGLSNRNPVRYTLKVIPDRPPSVQMELAGVGELITPPAELPIELRCEDAYGLGAVRLLVQAGDRPERAVAMEGFSAGARNFSTKRTLAAATTGVVPGDRLRLWAEAADLDPRGPNVGATPPVTLRVVSREEFLLEMGRRELGLRQEFERLRSTQHGLQNALEGILSGLGPQGPPPERAGQRLAGLARRQSEQAGRCLTIGRGFERVLAEMQVSRAARPADQRRIMERVVFPLDRLAGEAIPAAADGLAALRRRVTPANLETSLATQDEVLRRMGEILANMLEWEGYREAVALLQEVIDAQTKVRAQTLQELERQLEDILGLDEPLEGAGAEPPKP